MSDAVDYDIIQKSNSLRNKSLRFLTFKSVAPVVVAGHTILGR